MNQRGFIFPGGLTLYIGLGALVLIGLMAIALKVQTIRLASVKAEYALFVAETKAAGEAQNARSKQIEAKHVQIVKEKNDENKLAHANLADVSKRLRDNRASRGILSGITTPTNRDHLVCFSRNDFDGAFEQFDSGLSDISKESDQRAIDLATGREWLKDISK